VLQESTSLGHVRATLQSACTACGLTGIDAENSEYGSQTLTAPSFNSPQLTSFNSPSTPAESKNGGKLRMSVLLAPSLKGCIFVSVHDSKNFFHPATHGWERPQGFLPQPDESYFTTAEKKLLENCRCIVPNFNND
jgi:hypothetical protein